MAKGGKTPVSQGGMTPPSPTAPDQQTQNQGTALLGHHVGGQQGQGGGKMIGSRNGARQGQGGGGKFPAQQVGMNQPAPQVPQSAPVPVQDTTPATQGASSASQGGRDDPMQSFYQDRADQVKRARQIQQAQERAQWFDTPTQWAEAKRNGELNSEGRKKLRAEFAQKSAAAENQGGQL